MGRPMSYDLNNPPEDEGREPKKPWRPNKERKVRSKKAFDQHKMNCLVNDDTPAYKGQLDPRKNRRDEKQKPRSISRSEQKVRAKARALASAEEGAGTTQPREFTDFRSEFYPSEATPGRLGALFATQQVRQRKAFAQDVIEASIDRSRLSDQDRAFATLLTLGVVSTQGALDAVIDRCLQSPSDIKPGVRDALRISAYELIYLRKEPHAALDQGVELVRSIAPSAAGLGNAVLHRVQKAAEAFPFGDPSKDIEALALLYGFPLWLTRKLICDLGPQEAVAFMQASNEPAPLFIAVNALRATDEEVISLFEEVGSELQPQGAGGVEVAGCYRVVDNHALNDGRIKRLFSQGKILVSDAAAQAVAASVLESGCPEDLLEVGAGRGTKTILIQSDAQRRFGHQIKLTPLDAHGFKADLLIQRVDAYGVTIEPPITGNATRLDSVIGDRMFSRIFIDAPCSGLGTLRRHHEIRWRITPEQIQELAQTNLALLRSAASHIQPGGELIYSTCTVTYDENNGTVKAFLESPEGRDFTLSPLNGKACFCSQLTSGSPDAHFAAKFTKKC